MVNLAKYWFNALLGLFYPTLCLICDENLIETEHHICAMCLYDLPRTRFNSYTNNLAEEKFRGKLQTTRCYAHFYFEKGGKFQTILHQLKYKGKRDIGCYFGEIIAKELVDTYFFEDIDYLVPVPLHTKRLKSRGYNQSLAVVEGLAKDTGIAIENRNLIRKEESGTQTRRSVYERYENTKGIFSLNDPQLFAEKHILLVDDVLTTGSTLEAAAQAILTTTTTCEVSILTVAMAR